MTESDELMFMGEARCLLFQAHGLLHLRSRAEMGNPTKFRELTLALEVPLGQFSQMARNNGVAELPRQSWIPPLASERLLVAWKVFRDSARRSPEDKGKLYLELWFALDAVKESVDGAYWRARDSRAL